MRTDDVVLAALDELAAAAAGARDDACTRAALALIVVTLEAAASARLGPAAADPLVVLQRRLGRVHRLLAQEAPGTLTPGHVRGLLTGLRFPEPAADVVRSTPLPSSGPERLPVAC